MRIIGICLENDGPGYHRILLPLLNMEGDVLITNSKEKIESFLKDGCDIFMFNRHPRIFELEQVLQWKKEYGFKIVVDIDDYWLLDPHHIAYPDWIHFGITEKILASIEIADQVFCTHDRLKVAIQSINHNVEILPNAIPKRGQFAIDNPPGKRVRIFWSGSITHLRDIEILRNPFKRLYSSAINEKVMVVMGGYVPDQPHWDEMASAFTCGMQLKGVVLNGLPPDKYYSLYQYADIAVIPLKDSLFNSYKSNLKVLEAANIGVPCIVSKVNPYLDLPVNYVERQPDWFAHIRDLVNDPAERFRRGQQLKKFCDQHFNFEKINEQRLKVFGQITGNYIYQYAE
jgi:glycosyltransferase involved in cell wall biosynthesis